MITDMTKGTSALLAAFLLHAHIINLAENRDRTIANCCKSPNTLKQRSVKAL